MFNPIELVAGDEGASKYWRIKPFVEQAGSLAKDQIEAMLGIGVTASEQQATIDAFERQVAVWERNPFDPHAVARVRPGVYQRTLLRKYFDNLIAWADHLFRRDTIESISEATVLYVLLRQLLGARPHEVPAPNDTAKTFADLRSEGLDAFSNAAIALESWIHLPSVMVEKVGCAPDQGNEAWVRVPVVSHFWYFCYPPNPELLKYWDIVEDRLFKIRHCQNIEGVTRSLALFEPPIDPALLVQAAAAGVDLQSLLAELDSGLPPYRFRGVIARASGFAGSLRGLAGALLSALEKQDAEQLARIRSEQELEMLSLAREIRTRQIGEVREAIESLTAARRSAEGRRDHYDGLIDVGKSTLEERHFDLMKKAQRMRGMAQIHQIIGGILSAFPQISLFPPNSEVGGVQFANVLNAAASSMMLVASEHDYHANKNSIEAGYQRRVQDWELQRDQATHEIERIDRDLAAARIRLEIAERELQNHDRQTEHSRAVDLYMRSKFTNRELYDWMLAQLSTLYFQTYQLAFDLAKRAERAYRHELAIPSTEPPIIKYGYWDSLRRGLLAGDRTHLLNALGQPMRSWDDRDRRHSITYDQLRRPVDRTVSVGGGAEKLLSRILYGDLLASPATTNHAGRVYRCYDGAGVATTLAFDFKGQPVEEQRQLVAQKTAQANWSILLGEDTIAEMATAAASLLDAETFSASSERDALGRVLTAVSPDGSEVHYHYDEGGALQRVTLHHRGSATEQTPVGEITYDAKGRRESVTYGPLASPTSTTNYTYDELSQRLTRLRTVRASDDEAIQSLHYHYDAVGNITDIRDTAQQTVYFQNSVVEAANTYTYDGLYRLVEATGREHASEGTSQRTNADLTATAQPMTSDPSAMRRYTQQYAYDEVGNILEMRHIPATGTGWTRYYEYDENGNRLLATSAPGDDPEGPYSHEYPHDAHGNMTAMPHLSAMVWNHDDELVSAVAGTETVYFQYAGGNRARKYTEKSGSTTEERIYLGNFEIYRKRVSGSIDVERESLHVSDDTGRILLIETKTIDAGSAITTPTGIWRYQISNHLGSASTELTAEGDVISYEEHHPYGTTAYRAVESSIDVSAKRYRYTGMERDEETGLAYHTARYYAGWLGRWTASDPIGLRGGASRYRYVGGNPIGSVDLNGDIPPGANNSPADQIARDMIAPDPLTIPDEPDAPLEPHFAGFQAIPSSPPPTLQTKADVKQFISHHRDYFGISKEAEKHAASMWKDENGNPNTRLGVMDSASVFQWRDEIQNATLHIQATMANFRKTSLRDSSAAQDTAFILAMATRESQEVAFSTDTQTEVVSGGRADTHPSGAGGLDNLWDQKAEFDKAGLFVAPVNPAELFDGAKKKKPAWIHPADMLFAHMVKAAADQVSLFGLIKKEAGKLGVTLTDGDVAAL